MKGTVLDFSIKESRGLISGDDGQRYELIGAEWQSKDPPVPGRRVDFVVEGQSAKAVYIDVRENSTGFYRSSDDKMLAGVCAGLAHKWDLPVIAVRLAVVFIPLWPLWVILYIVAAGTLPQSPTRA